MLGPLGLRIFEAWQSDIGHLGVEHCATRRLQRLAQVAVVRLPRMHRVSRILRKFTDVELTC